MPEQERARDAMREHVAAELEVKTGVLRTAVMAAAGLFLVKTGAALLTNSLAILASGLDSLLDAGISGLNWYSTVAAERPPDPEHPYGHGKIESLVGAAQALLLVGVSVWIGVRAVERLLAPQPLRGTGWGIAAMVASAVVALVLARSIRRRARASESPILAAEQLHYSMDFFSHAGVILALALQELTGEQFFDPFVSLLIAAFVVWQVRSIAVESIQDLLDRELPTDIQSRIVEIIEAHRPQVIAYHGLRTRRAGSQKMVSVHLVLCRKISFEASHHVVDHVEDELREEIPRADVTIHADPCGEYCPGEARCPWARLLKR